MQDKGDAEIRDTIKLRQTRPFVAKDQGYLIPKKSVFNRIIGDSHFELVFARFLEDCDDVVSYAKNYLAVHFKLDYVNADGDISNYYPDFLVKLSAKRIVDRRDQRARKTWTCRSRCNGCGNGARTSTGCRQTWNTTLFMWTRRALSNTNHISFRQLVDGFREYKEKI